MSNAERIWIPDGVAASFGDEQIAKNEVEYIRADLVSRDTAPQGSEEDTLHLAICQATFLMNQGDHQSAHDTLRQVLVDYADRKGVPP